MKKQAAFSLIEILLALLLGLIVITAAITIYINTIKSNANIINSTRLNHDLELAMSLMINDIRRSGYWGKAIIGSNAMENPFTQPETTIEIFNFADPTIPVNLGDCILYSYDADGDGVFDEDNDGIVDDRNEFYGFRLNGATIQMRLTGDNTVDCGNGSWNTGEIIEGDVINITALQFTPIYNCSNVSTGAIFTSDCLTAETLTAISLDPDDDFINGHKMVELRQIDILIAGQLINDPSIIKTITSTVKVRNNRIFPY